MFFVRNLPARAWFIGISTISHESTTSQCTMFPAVGITHVKLWSSHPFVSSYSSGCFAPYPCSARSCATIAVTVIRGPPI